jgi:NhaP-type Na+/H+ or K+/H+ antiporter
MHELYLAFLIIGLLVMVLGVFSAPIKNRFAISSSLLALLLGAVIGPALHWLDPAGWHAPERILEEAARLTLAIGLMAVALRLPPRYFLDRRRLQALLLGLLMPLMWWAASLLAGWLLGLPVLLALLVGGIVTPTDPVVASSIVTAESAKKHLPDHLRNALSGESGMNDGLASLFVLLPVLLLNKPADAALAEWLLTTLLHEVIGGIVLGLAIGYGAGRLLVWAEARQFIEPFSFLGYTVALALLTVGAGRLLQTNDILAVFIAGQAFDNAVGGKERAEEEKMQEMVNQFFSVPIFTLFGAMLPIAGWRQLGWRGVLVAAAILLLRRLPAVLVLRPALRPLQRWRDALFLGWFGPIGVSAIFYVTLAVRRSQEEILWPIASLIICASILAHGMTATPLTRWYGRGRTTEEQGG